MSLLSPHSVKRLAAVLVLVLAVPLLLSAKVRTFAPKGADVGANKTYHWVTVRVMTRTGMVEDDDLIAPVIKAVVNRELAARGYVEVAEGGDLQVTAGGFGTTGSQLEGFLAHWSFDFYTGYGVETAAPVNRNNVEGTLAVVLADTKTNKGVWGGITKTLIGSQAQGGGTMPKSLIEEIGKAARSILKKLPESRQ
jgi:hypothetical protein